MGLMDELLSQAGGLGSVAGLAAKNPQIVAAAASILSSKQSSIGGATGMSALLSAFQSKGLDNVIESWIGTGKNQSIDASEIPGLLGESTISEFAKKAGLDLADAGPALAALLPLIVDALTPKGQVPEESSLEGALGSLLSALG